MICAIVAVDQNWGIGYKGNLLCHLKDDLKRFKQITEDNTVVMGMTTYESLPKKPLSNRTNIVITHQYDVPYKDEHGTIFMNMDCFKQYLIDYKMLEKIEGADIYIIGGASIYKQLLSYCDFAFVTKIYNSFKADTYFPNLDIDSNWLKMGWLNKVTDHNNNIIFQYYLYKKNIA